MNQKRIRVVFYRTESENEPVREWLLALSDKDRKIIGDDLQTLEFGWPMGMPVCRTIKSRKGLWEVQSRLTGGRSARVMFCIAHDRMVLLHGFIKKTQKTQQREIEVAVKRMKGEDDG
jgi:phage-related protein